MEDIKIYIAQFVALAIVILFARYGSARRHPPDAAPQLPSATNGDAAQLPAGRRRRAPKQRRSTASLPQDLTSDK